MAKTLACLLATCSLVSVAAAANDRFSADPQRNWGQWRGPLSTGVAPHADPPTEWNQRDGKNIRWKTALSGVGHSTPVVWGDRVFVMAAVPGPPLEKPFHDHAPGSHDNVDVTRSYEFVVLAVGRRDGKILWQRTLQKAVPHEGGHYTGSLANHSPITDGERVYAFFGSRGLYCLDFDGELKWKLDLGRMDTLHAHGEGASPVLHGETLVVNWDHEGKSFVVALDKRTGEQRWKVDRQEITSWATPIVVEHEGRPQLVISGTNRVRGYDLATGKVLWECGGLSANVVASPVAGGGMVFAGSSYDKRALLAIKLAGAKGDITGTQQVAWSRSRGTPYVPSPLLYDDALYFLTHYQGILTRVHAESGDDRPGAIRLEGMREIYSSPVGAGGRVYVTDRDGATVVITHGDIPRIIAVNQVDDTISASAAIAGRELFLRGEKFLYCIAE
ncbi:MAG: PQQ-like beta-propeller repeat protein [Planctomycetia bacterium]|nr:PQQ-like beta-propeller repeat protein [Planctomycetia bacterium]